MPKLPVLSGRKIIKALTRQGFKKVGQKGSHVRLKKNKTIVIVPLHREIAKGTLKSIIRQSRMTTEEFLDMF